MMFFTGTRFKSPALRVAVSLALLASMRGQTAVAEVEPGALSATGWQLVEIPSMNDTVASPEEADSHLVLKDQPLRADLGILW